jgi:hypothetical protein
MCPDEIHRCQRARSHPAEGVDDKIYFDDALACFGIRLRRTGGKTWLVQYAIAGRTRRVVIGPLAVFDISRARERLVRCRRIARAPAW